jgi:hypothetical protein
VVEGLVPAIYIAIEPDDYLKKTRPKRSITAKKFENYHATNIVEKQVKNNYNFNKYINKNIIKQKQNIRTKTNHSFF